MRPYIILNGKNSDEIEGLLIQTLPPISKPEMRVSTEEIDGRDGDLTTFLGFASYDKTISIGLTRGYDVDEVIKFFNSKGIVTFSNEPDKFYNYEIVKNIDLEKLLRFKTGEVTFHIQPYKYSLTRTPLDFKGAKNLINTPDYYEQRSGLELSVQNNIIHAIGESTEVTFVVPIDTINLTPGKYKLNVFVSGTGSTGGQFAVISDVPTTGTSFGNNFINLIDNQLLSLDAEFSTPKSFNYLYMKFPENVHSFKLFYQIIKPETASFKITNCGNVESLPIMTLYGVGATAIYINDTKIFDISLGEEEYITLDAPEMEARKDNVLKNRLVSGDYDKFMLKPGENIIKYDGFINLIKIEKYSRWL